jgi:hypothetical protein
MIEIDGKCEHLALADTQMKREMATVVNRVTHDGYVTNDAKAEPKHSGICGDPPPVLVLPRGNAVARAQLSGRPVAF